MTMNCVEWELKLNAALDGELAPADRAALDAHVASCADCRRTRDVLQAQARELEALRIDPAALAEKIIAAVHAEAAPRRGFGGFLAIAAAAAVIVAGILLMGDPAPKPIPVPPTLAQLKAATGPVEWRSGDRWSPLLPGGELRAGSTVRTGEASKCELAFADGTLLRLNAATEIDLQQPRQVRLTEGELFARVSPQQEPFRFSTEQGAMQAKGGAFDLSYLRSTQHPQKFNPPIFVTTLSVLEGSAKILEQDIAAPMSCIVDQKVATPMWSDPLLKTRWTHELMKLKPREDPELGDRVVAMLTTLGRTKQPDLFETEIRALGDRSVPALLRLVKNLPAALSAYDRRNAARLLSDLAGPSEVESLVALTQDPDGDVNESAVLALMRITGKRLKGPEAWSQWYGANRRTWGGTPERPPK